MAETVAYKYRAFISYSHADTSWAKWLHRGLESFRIDKDLVGRETATGTIPKSLHPIFRDRDDFTAGHTLSEQTLAALDASHVLIVICSPASAKSAYVTEEIRLFKSRHPDRPVIPLIVDGKPGDSDLECFPPSLRFKLDEDGQITDEPLEVLAADAREEGDGKHLALAKVVAGILGVSSDDIFLRAERARRRRQRTWIAGLTAVALTLGSLAVWAEINRQEAVEQRREGERRFDLAADGLLAVILEIAPKLPRQELRTLTEPMREVFSVVELVKRSTELNPFERRRLSVAYFGFGNLLRTQGKHDEALRYYQDGFALREDVAKANPSDVSAQRDLVDAYEKIAHLHEERSNFSDALEAYRNSLAIGERLFESDSDEWSIVARTYNSIGDVHKAQGNLVDALQAYKNSVALRERVAAESNVADALQAYMDSLALSERLVKGDNSGVSADFNTVMNRLADASAINNYWLLANGYSKVGDTLKAQGRLDAALSYYQTSLALRERVAKANPSNVNWQRSIAMTHSQIGKLLDQQGQTEKALEAFHQARANVERLIKESPDNAQLTKDLATLDDEITNLREAR